LAVVRRHGLRPAGHNRLDHLQGFGLAVVTERLVKADLTGCLAEEPQASAHRRALEFGRVNHEHVLLPGVG